MRIGTSGRWLIVLVSLFLLYLLVGFVLLPRWLKTELIEQAQARDVSLSIAELKLNPLALSLTVEGLEAIDGQSRPLIRFDRLHVNASILSLFTLSARLSEVRLEAAQLHVELDDSGQVHWQSLIPLSDDANPVDEAGDAEPADVVIDRLVLTDSALTYTEPAHPAGYQTRITQINLDLSDLDTRQGANGQFSINLAPEVDGAITLDGQLSLNPLKLDAVLETRQVRLESAWRYAQFMHGLTLRQATLDGRIDLSVSLVEGVPVLTAEQGQFELTDVDVRMPDEAALLSWQRVAAGPISMDSQAGEIVIDRVTFDGVDAHLLRNDQGLAVLNQLLSASLAETVDAIETRIQTQPGVTIDPDRIVADYDQEELTAEGVVEEALADQTVDIDQQVLPWRIQVLSTAWTDSRIHWRDQSVAPVAQLLVEVTRLELSQFEALNPASLDYQFEGRIAGAKLSADGEVVLTPEFQQTSSVDIAALPVSPFQGYLNEFSQLQVPSGNLDLTLDISLSEAWSVTGQAGLAEVTIRNSGSSLNPGADLLSFDALDATGLVIDSAPLSVELDALMLSAPKMAIALGADGQNNLDGLFPVPDDVAAETVVQGEPDKAGDDLGETSAVLFAINQVTIRDGSVSFRDESTPTVFQISASDLQLDLSDLSSKDEQVSEIELSTRLDGYADVRLSGRMTPMRYQQNTELTVEASQLDLTTLNPYAHQYLGRLINRGQLVLKLDYSLDGQRMVGSNIIELQQIDLGQTVESEDAVSVPLDLALALLRGPDGNVELNVPVSGQLDDPQFKIGGIVFRAILNLIVKAVASPFSLLANLLPDAGDELQFVDFAPGTSLVTEAMQVRLATLADGLAQRPGLRLDIAGKADQTQDRPALAWQQWLVLNQLNPNDDEAVQALLVEQYRAMNDPADLQSDASEDADEPVESLPELAVMRAQVLSSIEVSDQSLRRLAEERALAIKNALLAVSPEMAERVFLLPERVIQSPDSEAIVRLEMSLSAQ